MVPESSAAFSSVSSASGRDPPLDATRVGEDAQKIRQNDDQSSGLSNNVPNSVPPQDEHTRGNTPSPPSAEHGPGVQAVPNSGEELEGIGLRNPLPRKLFGLNRGEPGVQGPPTDYRRKYAEDPPYKELDPEARVWHVYNDESAIFDNDMMIESGDSLDILLVFAGLFSGVLTTFVAQTSQALAPDNTAISSSILLELVALQRAQANGTSLDSIPPADISFTAARTDIWVNGLWFTSLALSLTTALLAVLAKQWLRQYSSFITGSARERALIHQFRHACFDKWGVQFIIGLLPTVLHLALFLFMAGLVIFLFALDHIIARVVTAIAGFLGGTYLITNVLPLVAIECPYRTPLTAVLYSFVYGPGRNILGLILGLCLRTTQGVLIFFFIIPYMFGVQALGYFGLLKNKSSWLPARTLPLDFKLPPHKNNSLRQDERAHILFMDQLWTNVALSWLASTTSDPSAKIILVEALGTIHTLDNVQTLLPVFSQQWRNTSFVDNEPSTLGEEMLLARLIRSTITQNKAPTIYYTDTRASIFIQFQLCTQ
ncbi:hypothetical protein MVEN_01755400 [Mycena venus]|uniref:DUF6535 domain-containing protein n=1 Tax=Mycena venus TaxID=2733690 RepID=A0A8H7CMJ1_9AGAR|nr:hypothetical protein MVEN_01755400 [Mycena venus]